MGCIPANEVSLEIVHQFWDSLPIVSLKIEEYTNFLLKEFVLQGKKDYAKLFNTFSAKYLTTNKNPQFLLCRFVFYDFFMIHEKKPHLVFLTLMLLCKPNIDKFISCFSELHRGLDGPSQTISFNDDGDLLVQLKSFIKILKMYINLVTYFAVPYIAPKEPSRKAEFINYFQKIFQKKFEDTYVCLRIKNLSCPYFSLKQFLERYYGELDHFTIREVMLCEYQDEMTLIAKEREVRVSEEENRFKEKEKMLITKLEEERLQALIELEKKLQEEEFQRLTEIESKRKEKDEMIKQKIRK